LSVSKTRWTALPVHGAVPDFAEFIIGPVEGGTWAQSGLPPAGV